MMKDYKFSHVRADFLHKTVEYLRKHGTVFLVRLPVGRRITAIEQRFMPKFESKIQRAIAASDGYFDMTSLNAKYRYPDGNHIYRESAIEASAEIGRWILNQLAPQFAIGEPTTTPQAY